MRFDPNEMNDPINYSAGEINTYKLNVELEMAMC